MSRIWQKNYPVGVPSEINADEYTSIIEMVEESFKKFASKPAFYCMGKTLTYKDIDIQSRNFAAYLQSKGLKYGDRLAIMMPNLLQYPIAIFGALRAGVVLVNTNPLYTEREMEHQFKDSGATAILIAENYAFNLQNILSKTSIKTVIVTSIGEMLGLKGYLVNFVVRKLKKLVPAYRIPGAVTMKEALSAGAAASFTKVSTTSGETIAIQYTGGTTGVSKGAMLTNRNLVANMLQVKGMMGNKLAEGAEVILTPLPMYHIYSFTVNCMMVTCIGGLNVLVVNPRDQKALMDDLRSHKFTMMTGVNTLFNALLNNPEFSKLDFSTWKIVSAGAMALQRPVYDRFLEQTGVCISEGYGMTEASPVVSTNPFDGTSRVGTIGLPLPSTDIRIYDVDKNQVVGVGERGEIQVKGPQVMAGYYNRPDETENSIIDGGWLRTGDIGIMDEDGFIQIVDRLKDMILVSGFNVYPNEIEEVLAGHPKILESAAIGVPDAGSGEAVKVFIVKKDASLTVEEVKEFCALNLTGYKKPKHVEFRDELPKTPVGKILRRMLRD